MSGAAQIPVLARVGSWWRGALRFGNGVLGADKYEHYVQYHRASGCGRSRGDRRTEDAEDQRDSAW